MLGRVTRAGRALWAYSLLIHTNPQLVVAQPAPCRHVHWLWLSPCICLARESFSDIMAASYSPGQGRFPFH
jgi:hypothetical protein